jgi:hypothetical protein
MGQDGRMGEIVNLRQVKRQRAKAAAAAEAAARRDKHGQTAATKRAAKREEAARDKVLDQARLQPDDKPQGTT